MTVLEIISIVVLSVLAVAAYASWLHSRSKFGLVLGIIFSILIVFSIVNLVIS